MFQTPSNFSHPDFPSKQNPGFTLVETLVAIAVLGVMIVILSAILSEITRAWKSTSGTTEGLRDSRAAFEALTRTISHATLNTYYDYVDSSGNFRTPVNAATFVPASYARQSDLQFVSGTASKTLLSSVSSIPYPITHSIFFMAPQGETNNTSYNGLNSTLNACGFYVMYGPDPSVPVFLPGGAVPVLNRYRLMQFTEPTEYLSIYDPQTQGTTSATWNKWFLGPLGVTTPTTVSQLAENVVALIILPQLSPADQAAHPSVNLAPNYDYDSRDSTGTTTFNQLPPVVDITMVVIDESSALKLGNTATPPGLSTGAAFTNSAQLQSDLSILENNLSAASGNAAANRIPLHFRVFHSQVAMQGAKWSN